VPPLLPPPPPAGEPIQAACCCLAADDVSGALACLLQGGELELAAALALALLPGSAACDAALAACARRAQMQGCFNEAAALLDKVGRAGCCVCRCVQVCRYPAVCAGVCRCVGILLLCACFGQRQAAAPL
jgi:hypothetical protein